MLPIVQVGCKRAGYPPAKFQLQPEVVYDLFRKQTNEVRITRNVGVVVWKNLLLCSGTADVIVFLQHQDIESGLSQIRSRDQAVMTRSKNNRVVTGLHSV